MIVQGVVYDFNKPLNEEAFEQLTQLSIQAIILNAFTQLPRLRKFHELSTTEFFDYVETNIRGNLSLIHHLLPKMKEQQFGRLVLISSLSSVMGTAYYGPYCTAKAAIEGFFLNLAAEYSRDNILANIARLGLIKTTRTKRFWQRKSYQEKVNRLIPQGQMGLPMQVAEAVNPFLSSHCYMSGSIFNVSGGLPLMTMGN